MNCVTFHCVVSFAQFCAELTRQGIAFQAFQCSDEFKVTLTGY